MQGDVAQMVERSLSMREVRGSIPRFSKFLLFTFIFILSSEFGPSQLVKLALSARAGPLSSEHT
jgi:hypothetical protein